jgi:hypothetical protein
MLRLATFLTLLLSVIGARPVAMAVIGTGSAAPADVVSREVVAPAAIPAAVRELRPTSVRIMVAVTPVVPTPLPPRGTGRPPHVGIGGARAP